MRLTTGTGQYDMGIQGDGVSEDGVLTDESSQPLEKGREIVHGPEVQVVQNTPEMPTALERIRGIVLNITNVPGAPDKRPSGFGRTEENLYEN